MLGEGRRFIDPPKPNGLVQACYNEARGRNISGGRRRGRRQCYWAWYRILINAVTRNHPQHRIGVKDSLNERLYGTWR
jgi:hypothetical protein